MFYRSSRLKKSASTCRRVSQTGRQSCGYSIDRKSCEPTSRSCEARDARCAENDKSQRFTISRLAFPAVVLMSVATWLLFAACVTAIFKAS